MTARKSSPGKSSGTKKFQIAGSAAMQGCDSAPAELQLMAYAYDGNGNHVGSAPLNANGTFKLATTLSEASDVEVIIAPEADPKTVRRADVVRQRFEASQWSGSGATATLKPEFMVAERYFTIWAPQRICVSGHVRNKVTTEQGTSYCPVPFAKVEVFDVDREPCWWPYLTLKRARLGGGEVSDLTD